MKERLLLQLQNMRKNMKIYLIRHGETDWNRIHRFQGREDIELNADGIAQAAACGRSLSGLGITAVYTSPLKRAHRTGEEIARQIGLAPENVQPLPELIERDLGPFSGQLVKDKKEYFALAAGDHVEGMEPFYDVQRRMEQAVFLLAQSGAKNVVAVSHGAAINVLLAGLTDNRMGTGKTKLYNGAITVIEGDKERGFSVSQCNLAPDAPKTHEILRQDRGYELLEQSLVDIVKEEQAKLGFRKEAIRLYYPLSTLNHFFDREDTQEEMQKRLAELPETLRHKLGDVQVTAKADRFCFHIPEEGSVYVKEHTKPNEFIRKLVELVGRHKTTMEMIRTLFMQQAKEAGEALQQTVEVEMKPMDNGEFDWMFRFINDPEDLYYYCFKDEGIHIIYHRFLPEDYADFEF